MLDVKKQGNKPRKKLKSFTKNTTVKSTLTEMNDNKMKEEELKELGFKFVKRYDHNEFHTNRYEKGLLEVEFTYEGDKLLTCDLTISELNCVPVTLEDMKALTPILGKWTF